jgi:hypothetical protein
MFFVGITSSLLPYLFLLGIVFIFLVQTSAQSFDDASYFDDTTVHVHQIYISSDTDIFSGSGNFFAFESGQDLSLKKSECKDKQSVMLPFGFPDGVVVSWAYTVFQPSFKNKRAEFYFFGLSPPDPRYI